MLRRRGAAGLQLAALRGKRFEAAARRRVVRPPVALAPAREHALRVRPRAGATHRASHHWRQPLQVGAVARGGRVTTAAAARWQDHVHALPGLQHCRRPRDTAEPAAARTRGILSRHELARPLGRGRWAARRRSASRAAAAATATHVHLGGGFHASWRMHEYPRASARNPRAAAATVAPAAVAAAKSGRVRIQLQLADLQLRSAAAAAAAASAAASAATAGVQAAQQHSATEQAGRRGGARGQPSRGRAQPRLGRFDLATAVAAAAAIAQATAAAAAAATAAHAAHTAHAADRPGVALIVAGCGGAWRLSPAQPIAQMPRCVLWRGCRARTDEFRSGRQPPPCEGPARGEGHAVCVYMGEGKGEGEGEGEGESES